MASDPFEDVLNLEDQYFDQGFTQGYDDGYRAGKIEGRSVGLKTGFEKFIEAGRLQGKAIVWANRLPNLLTTLVSTDDSNSDSIKSHGESSSAKPSLPPLSSNARLEKNVSSFHALVEPGTLSTENNDEAVNDFDDRVKRAQGKLKIIERIVGEVAEKGSSKDSPAPNRKEI